MDFIDTSAPAAKRYIILPVVAFSSKVWLEIYHVDLKSAFLNGVVEVVPGYEGKFTSFMQKKD